eukprot:4854059-Amphidinium_carterae.1
MVQKSQSKTKAAKVAEKKEAEKKVLFESLDVITDEDSFASQLEFCKGKLDASKSLTLRVYHLIVNGKITDGNGGAQSERANAMAAADSSGAAAGVVTNPVASEAESVTRAGEKEMLPSSTTKWELLRKEKAQELLAMLSPQMSLLCTRNMEKARVIELLCYGLCVEGQAMLPTKTWTALKEYTKKRYA